MKKTFQLWSNMFASPSKGFPELTPATPILMPIIVVLILVLAGLFMLMPILGSDAYLDALGRVQVNTLVERGTEMSTEQLEMMEQQLKSDQMRTINLATTIGGGLIGYIIILLVYALILLILTRIFKEKPGFKHLFKLLIFLAVISAVQGIVKNGITLLSNYERILSKVQYTADLQWAITSPVSLAALFNPAKTGPTLYTVIDAVTDIFNWIYFIYLYFGLKFSAGLARKKALTITIIAGALSVIVSAVMTLVL
ncbi:MAG TPA: hypothetical protein DCO79_06890 [Spirochaeta sp.]|nr:hypothetical protein [Spirochaeta sp.]